jgi:hypothetical protein
MAFFWRSVLIAMAYGAAYALVRELYIPAISRMNWIPMAALRFTCLLFVPVRYWPALIIGEGLPLGYQSYLCLDQCGLAWVLVNSIPSALYVAPIVYGMRKWTLGFEKQLPRNIGGLLLCMLLASLTVGLFDTLSYSLPLHREPGEHVLPYAIYGIRRIMGNYLSILMITPIVLWLAQAICQAKVQQASWRVGIANALNDAQWHATGLLMGSVAVLTSLGYVGGDTTHLTVLSGVVLLLMVAAWHYGWQSAVLVSAAANLAAITLMPTRDDMLTIVALVMITVIQSTALLLGARTTTSQLWRRAEAVARDALAATQQEVALAYGHVSSARQLARREQCTGERVRQDQAAMLAGMADDMRMRFMRVMQDARRGALNASQLADHFIVFDASYQEHQRLVEALWPVTWEDFGGPVGPLAERLQGLGIEPRFRPRSVESGACTPSEAMHQAAYRFACAGMVLMLRQACTDTVELSQAIRMEGGDTLFEGTLESMGRPITINPHALDDLKPYLNVDDEFAKQQMLDWAVNLWDGGVRFESDGSHHMRIVFWMREKEA